MPDIQFFSEKELQGIYQWQDTIQGDGETACRTRLLTVLSAIPHLQELYRKRGYPPELIDGVLADIRSWSERCEKELGWLGLPGRLYGWIRLFLKGELIQTGRFQSQFPQQWIGPDRPGLNQGDVVINMHIPAWGGPLTQSACIETFHTIRQFFATHHPDYDYKGLVIYSWLLDPVFAKMIPGSNIAEFQTFGHPVEMVNDETTEVIWRVFGAAGINSVKTPNRLQKSVADYIAGGGKFREWAFYVTREELEQDRFWNGHGR